MKLRLISSVVAVAILLLAMFMPVWVFLVIASFIAFVGIVEYAAAIQAKGFKAPSWSVLSVVILAIVTWIAMLYPIKSMSINADGLILIWVLFALGIGCCSCVFTNMAYSFSDTAVTVFGMLYILLPFTLTVRIRSEEYGFYLIWLIFLGAWITDISAYFAGSFFGRNKLLPKISSNKTVEGFVGGILGCTLAILLFGVWMHTQGVPGTWWQYLVLGAVLGFVSQLGDWFASCIKRHLSIKDFGNIMPGHGGVLDRFDSLFFVAPAVYVFILLI